MNTSPASKSADPAPAATPAAMPARPAPNDWDGYAERLREKLPPAPVPLMDAYVRWAPWVAMVFGVLGALAMLALLGIGAVFSPLMLLGGSSGVSSGVGLFVTLILGIVTSLLEIVGGYMMLKRRLTGWWLLAVGLIVSAVSSLLSVALFGLVIDALLAYIHLSVKPRYS